MTERVTIRRADPTDADVLLAMMCEIAGAEAVGTVEVSAERLRVLLDRDDVVVFIAQYGGDAIGYVSAVRQLKIWVGRSIIALDDLYVRPGHRDRGVGRMLMAAMAAAAAPEQRIVRWELETDNFGAQRFYERLGSTLRTKLIAVWRPDAYASHVSAKEDAC
jgi:ribosomal protein S18 acetylase RimI-like enzyme